jgi:hypothetical protein
MGALLAQAVTYPELSGPLLVATMAATALWFVLLLGCAFATCHATPTRRRRPWSWATNRLPSWTC